MGAINKLKEFLLKDPYKDKPKLPQTPLLQGENAVTKKLSKYQQIIQDAESGK